MVVNIGEEPSEVPRQRTGELKPFPYGDESVGRPKMDDLEFATLAKPLR